MRIILVSLALVTSFACVSKTIEVKSDHPPAAKASPALYGYRTPRAALKTEEQLLATYSLNEFEKTLSHLDTVVQGGLWCGITIETAKNVMLPLRPLIEQKQAEPKQRQVNRRMVPSLNCPFELIDSLYAIYERDYRS